MPRWAAGAATNMKGEARSRSMCIEHYIISVPTSRCWPANSIVGTGKILVLAPVALWEAGITLDLLKRRTIGKDRSRVMTNRRQRLDVPFSYNRCRMPCVSISEASFLHDRQIWLIELQAEVGQVQESGGVNYVM